MLKRKPYGRSAFGFTSYVEGHQGSGQDIESRFIEHTVPLT
jgi:hypothetical protein